MNFEVSEVRLFSARVLGWLPAGRAFVACFWAVDAFFVGGVPVVAIGNRTGLMSCLRVGLPGNDCEWVSGEAADALGWFARLFDEDMALYGVLLSPTGVIFLLKESENETIL
jgi:hypothetical protein